ncbi:MAG: hypothetical protein JWO30_1364 [Fibrobacteres bacterium]|nr:hypothetical protein [Fibrobacterota bacterium]
MVPSPKQNEFNLAQRPPRERPTLEQMRSRLASAPPEAKVKLPKRKSRRPSGKSLAAMALFVAVLVGMNLLVRSHKDIILETIGIQTFATPLAPPDGLSLDDRARFWAYAAFDNRKLRERFHVLATAFIDPADARHHVEDVLTLELGAETRAEILALKQPPLRAAGP